jgi:hypothetical protein
MTRAACVQNTPTDSGQVARTAAVTCVKSRKRSTGPSSPNTVRFKWAVWVRRAWAASFHSQLVAHGTSRWDHGIGAGMSPPTTLSEPTRKANVWSFASAACALGSDGHCRASAA